MQENKVIGICKSVSPKNLGILLQTKENMSGEWWNGLSTCKDLVTQDLRGLEVELTITNQIKRKFSYLKVLNVENVANEIQEKRGVCGLTREQLIVRQNAGSHASIFIQTLARVGYYTGETKETMNRDFYEFAEEFERWVFNEKEN